MGPIRAKQIRLGPEAYRGERAVAFTCCTENRRRQLVDASVIDQLIETLRVQAERFLCLVPIYCFMPDHLHVVTWGVDDIADAKAATYAFKQKTWEMYGRHFWQ